MTGKKLLDLDDDGAGEELNLQVNTEYAKRFEVSWVDGGCKLHAGMLFMVYHATRFACVCNLQHNKKREELHKLQAKHPELAERIASKVWAAEVLAEAKCW